MATNTDRPRPRVRVLHADPEKPPVLVIDRWTGDPAELQNGDMREAGFSGVLVFQADIDLDDDGLDDDAFSAEAAAVIYQQNALEKVARDLVRVARNSAYVSNDGEHLRELRKALDRLDVARRTAGQPTPVPPEPPRGWGSTAALLRSEAEARG